MHASRRAMRCVAALIPALFGPPVQALVAPQDAPPTPAAETATLVGHIVDESGRLLVDGWKVSIDCHAQGRARQEHRVEPDAADGTFEVDGLTPGLVTVRAAFGRLGATRPQQIQVVAGERHEVELVYEGPNPDLQLCLTFRCAGQSLQGPAPGSVVALLDDGERLAFGPARGLPYWRAVAPRSGVYRVTVDDPLFLPVELDEVPTGAVTALDLVGSAALEVEVHDAKTGARFVAYDLELTPLEDLARLGHAPRTLARRDRAAPVHFDGIVPGDMLLTAGVPGYPRARVIVDDLAPRETRAVRVAVCEALALEGVVVDAAGTPLAGLVVDVTAGRVAGHTAGADSRLGPSGLEPPITASTRTDADGRFRVAGLGAGPYVVRASASLFVTTQALVELPDANEAELTLTLPRCAPLHLKLSSDVAPRAGRLAVSLPREGDIALQHPAAYSSLLHGLLELDAAGHVEPVVLPLGELSVALELRYGSEAEGWWSGVFLERRTLQHSGELVELDVSALLPGHLGIGVTGLTGAWQRASFVLEPVPGAAEDLRPIVGLTRPDRDEPTRGHVEFEGRAGVYRLVVRGLDREWTPARTFEVVRNEVRSAQVALPAEPTR